MIRKKISQRVGVFVDVSNLYHSAKNLYKAKVNFGEVLRAAVVERQLIRAIAYVVRGPGMEQESFFEALRKSEFEVKAKDLQVFAGGAKKGDWDVGLALDAIKIADHLDVVILVTGDGDSGPSTTDLIVTRRESGGEILRIAAGSIVEADQLLQRVRLDLDTKTVTEFLAEWRLPDDSA
jgi:uncharacterized LabA/DUF88 family protein